MPSRHISVLEGLKRCQALLSGWDRDPPGQRGADLRLLALDPGPTRVQLCQCETRIRPQKLPRRKCGYLSAKASAPARSQFQPHDPARRQLSVRGMRLGHCRSDLVPISLLYSPSRQISPPGRAFINWVTALFARPQFVRRGRVAPRRRIGYNLPELLLLDNAELWVRLEQNFGSERRFRACFGTKLWVGDQALP